MAAARPYCARKRPRRFSATVPTRGNARRRPERIRPPGKVPLFEFPFFRAEIGGIGMIDGPLHSRTWCNARAVFQPSANGRGVMRFRETKQISAGTSFASTATRLHKTRVFSATFGMPRGVLLPCLDQVGRVICD